MRNIDIILTVDYEIHGNGKGKFEDFCYRPTEMMLDIANKFNAKITFMVEMEHYFAMKKQPKIFKDDITLFEKQLTRAISEGHDVQLHLHPQWLNAIYKDGIWKFPYTAKEIALLCNDYKLAYDRVKKAKNWLENNLKIIDINYECIGFRAGYFQMQPSFNITRALLDNGIICDTSVAKGMYRNNDSVGKIDYRSVNSEFYPYRALLDDVSKEDKSSSLIEMPIFTLRVNKIIRKLKKTLNIKDKTHKISYTVSKIQRSKVPLQVNPAGKKVINKLMNKRWDFHGYQYVDFCIGYPHKMIKVITKIAKKFDQDSPIVFMGHSKDFIFANHFRMFLEQIEVRTGYSIKTLRSAIRKYY
ncbi:MAG: hypothetical protein JW866_10170 [Ignavibacteriales bacterium]|nr:hypothetical protein [Ignavibacteriales bacterium]